MAELTRRKFLERVGGGSAAASLALPLSSSDLAGQAGAGGPLGGDEVRTVAESLDGGWSFKLDPEKRGESEGWFNVQVPGTGWSEVRVPHTWQIVDETSDYVGTAWYHRSFEAPASWAGRTVRVEFEAVFHSATVWLNGKIIGKHLRKGYTAFTLNTAPALRLGEFNQLAVEVDNSFDEKMLPRGKSSDWTPDGGIIRPGHLLITPQTFIERIDVIAQPELESSKASVSVRVVMQNSSPKASDASVSYRIVEEDTGRTVLYQAKAARVLLNPGGAQEVTLPPATLPNPRLWHFDHPHLYRLIVETEQGASPLHSSATTFGVRKFEVKDGGFHLNGERVWLMGVERMAGSNPDHGMAEPETWIHHDHDELKHLNCVFTRVHWQQDRRVLDYCDRHGILIQEEVSAWGPKTFEGMSGEPDPAIMQNGLEQLREMINRDRNHPSIFAWGLCNEVDGQNPPAYEFAKQMYEEAKRLDPSRLLTYASHSLQKNPEKDVSGLMDFVEWNEYYGSWYKGSIDDMRRNLEEIHSAFPSKPIVISEYGYCECTPERTGGDPRRIEILSSHDAAFRQYDYVAGAIFFDYNDYRTHIGDKGVGALKQRVHGVVDLYGAHKPSFDALRSESSPLELLLVKPDGSSLVATVVTRSKLPAYSLDGYTVRWIVYGFDGLPMEKHEKPLPRLDPGHTTTVRLGVQEEKPRRVQVDVIRPTGFSVLTANWEPL